MIKLIILHAIIIFIYSFPALGTPSCPQTYSEPKNSKSEKLTLANKIIAGIYRTSIFNPESIQTLEKTTKINSQVITAINNLFISLKEAISIESDLNEANEILTEDLNRADREEYEELRKDSLAKLLPLKNEIRAQRERILNFIAIQNLYSGYNYVRINISNYEGSNSSIRFRNFIRKLYEDYSFKKGWSAKAVEESSSRITLIVNSSQGLSTFFNETGIHTFNTIQSEASKTTTHSSEKRRTEKIQVTVSPESGFHFSLKDSDVSVEQYNSTSGKGGQKRNKTSNDARATHTPSKIFVTSTAQRSFAMNKTDAIKKLKAKVQAYYYDMHQSEMEKKLDDLHLPSSTRPIRTYHFKERRIITAYGKKIPFTAKTLDELSSEVIFPIIDHGANHLFGDNFFPRLQDIHSKVKALNSQELTWSNEGLLNEFEALQTYLYSFE